MTTHDDQADAARYRWLRAFAQGHNPAMNGEMDWSLRLPSWALARACTIDGAIDLARQRQSWEATP